MVLVILIGTSLVDLYTIPTSVSSASKLNLLILSPDGVMISVNGLLYSLSSSITFVKSVALMSDAFTSAMTLKLKPS